MKGEDYSLRRSRKSIGHLEPVKVGPDGHIIDGVHRLKDDKDWPRVTLPHIDTRKKRLIARLAANFVRRIPSKKELRLTLNRLAEEYRSEGVEGSLSKTISDDTGISLSTVKRYLNRKYLDVKYNPLTNKTSLRKLAIADQPKPNKQPDFIESVDWHCPICNDHVAVFCNGRRHKLQVISSGK